MSYSRIGASMSGSLGSTANLSTFDVPKYLNSFARYISILGTEFMISSATF
jgi:hypothetical protein